MKSGVWKLSRRHHLRDQHTWFFSVHSSCTGTDGCFRLSCRLVLRLWCRELSSRARLPCESSVRTESKGTPDSLLPSLQERWDGRMSMFEHRPEEHRNKGEVRYKRKWQSQKCKVPCWLRTRRSRKWVAGLVLGGLGVRLEKTAASLVSRMFREIPGVSFCSLWSRSGCLMNLNLEKGRRRQDLRVAENVRKNHYRKWWNK